jgi:hypothetical protein
MSPYAETAMKWWQTYRPKAYATIAEADRPAFFEDLATQIEDSIEFLTEDNLKAVTRAGDSPEVLKRKRAMAMARAESETLEELLYHSPERTSPSPVTVPG